MSTTITVEALEWIAAESRRFGDRGYIFWAIRNRESGKIIVSRGPEYGHDPAYAEVGITDRWASEALKARAWERGFVTETGEFLGWQSGMAQFREGRRSLCPGYLYPLGCLKPQTRGKNRRVRGPSARMPTQPPGLRTFFRAR